QELGAHYLPPAARGVRLRRREGARGSGDVLVRLARHRGHHCRHRGPGRRAAAGARNPVPATCPDVAGAVVRDAGVRLAAARLLPAMSALAWLAAALAITSMPAMAGGEMGMHDEDPDEGMVFFGFVKDARGAPIPNAKVTATMKSGNT